jgi:lipopolysaccharide/colanic/teichoic acid biosynthesis glycosyltransferase
VFKAFTEIVPNAELVSQGSTLAARRISSVTRRPDPQRDPRIASDRLVRALDVTIASVALIAFAPLMLVIALTILVAGGGPVLFAQLRMGRDGKMFTCYKFRTMHNNAEAILRSLLEESAEARGEWARDHKLREDPRIVGIGSVLRRTSLDELPQLFNVLLGDMSIVGPRPIVASESGRYGRYLAAYCAVRPGITGLWQVSGRNDTTYRRRIACDVLYARSKSAGNDIAIIARTVPVVLFARGAY